jgi:hypothetical protein
VAVTKANFRPQNKGHASHPTPKIKRKKEGESVRAIMLHKKLPAVIAYV